MAPARTDRPIEEALPELLAAENRSLRSIAAAAGIERAFLSRALRRQDYKALNGVHAARLAAALDLPLDYFAEAREWAVLESIRRDAEQREALYRRLHPMDLLERAVAATKSK